ncbi:putative chloramphenical resistance permease RarD [Budvicia aquatica]|uniref:Putative chloramphenical resistance permease RarD n=1 Tax=Budvicia aquatica TaxID=82979 RepID=A0A484ZM32_9GAMM|nr:putative chloramphenical resistance permease RarD [Budvicia aquatica]
MKSRSGPALAIFSFILWGITPLFYRLLPDANPLELLAQRVFWSLPLLLLIRPLIKQRTLWRSVWQDKRSLFYCLLATSIMAVSWCTFTYAITHNQVLAASLGYFINPLFSILLGMIFSARKAESHSEAGGHICLCRRRLPALAIWRITGAGISYGRCLFPVRSGT